MTVPAVEWPEGVEFPYRPFPLPVFCWFEPWAKTNFAEDSDAYIALAAGRWWVQYAYSDGSWGSFSYHPTSGLYYSAQGLALTPYADQKKLIVYIKKMQLSIARLALPNPPKGGLSFGG